MVLNILDFRPPKDEKTIFIVRKRKSSEIIRYIIYSVYGSFKYFIVQLRARNLNKFSNYC